MAKEENAHAGHRERLRQKVEKYGLNALATHEVLEFLLTYAIPRKNTNDIAHNLLNKFGSLQNVVEASATELKKINGIGDNATLFLASLGQFSNMIKSTGKASSTFLINVDTCVKYFRANYDIGNTEKLYILCLNAMGKLIKTEIFDGSCNALVINKQAFTSMLIDENVGSIIVFHTHPDGEVKPSDEDLQATQSLMDICALLGVYFADHIIFNEREHYSMMRNTKDELKFNTNNSYLKHTTLRQHAKYT